MKDRTFAVVWKQTCKRPTADELADLGLGLKAASLSQCRIDGKCGGYNRPEPYIIETRRKPHDQTKNSSTSARHIAATRRTVRSNPPPISAPPMECGIECMVKLGNVIK